MATRHIPAKKEEQSVEAVAEAIVRAGYPLYRDRTGYPISQAQRNLEGKSIYLEDAQMKNRGATVTFCATLEEGLILGIIERIENKYRPVFFDIFGNVVYQQDIDESPKSNKQANMLFWQVSEDFDAVDLTIKAIDTKMQILTAELQTLENLQKNVNS